MLERRWFLCLVRVLAWVGWGRRPERHHQVEGDSRRQGEGKECIWWDKGGFLGVSKKTEGIEVGRGKVKTAGDMVAGV